VTVNLVICIWPSVNYTVHWSSVCSQLLEIMAEFTPDQQHAFCQFVTGASRLPTGGLAALSPKLTIVRKVLFLKSAVVTYIHLNYHYYCVPWFFSLNLVMSLLIVSTPRVASVPQIQPGSQMLQMMICPVSWRVPIILNYPRIPQKYGSIVLYLFV
jgi:hypothetical protein